MQKIAEEVELEALSLDDIQRLKNLALNNTYFMAKAILGYKKLVPHAHREPCDFFSAAQPGDHLLHLAPRDHFKSTIAKSDLIRRAVRNRNIRILIVNERVDNAALMLREIRQHFENNLKFRTFFPEAIPKSFSKSMWSQTTAQLPREAHWQEPTFTAAGVNTAVVSQHFDLIAPDDIIGRAAKDSPAIMEDAIEWLKYSVSLKTEPINSEIHMRGTRYHFNDVYSFAMNKMKFKTLRQKAMVLNAEGTIEPLFPELISIEKLRDILETDPEHYALHYANDPLDSSLQDFRKEWLLYYTIAPDRAIRYKDLKGETHYQDIQRLRVYTHVDPSLGENGKSDPSAVITVGVAPGPKIFVLEAWKRRVDPLGLVEKMLQVNNMWQPSFFTVEHVGYQKSLKYFAEREAQRRGTYLRVEPYSPPTNKAKNARIRSRLQPYWSIGSVFVQSSQLELIEEYLHFGHSDDDHLMDALAQGPEFWREPLDDIALNRFKRLERELLVDRGVTGYGL